MEETHTHRMFRKLRNLPHMAQMREVLYNDNGDISGLSMERYKTFFFFTLLILELSTHTHSLLLQISNYFETIYSCSLTPSIIRVSKIRCDLPNVDLYEDNS